MIDALLLMAQIVAAPAPAMPIATTIAAIHANPSKFDGRVVRLQGWVNKCQPLSCAIEEHAARSPGGAGQGVSIAADSKFDGTIGPLLPTYVEFDARLDATCLTTTGCTDRAPILTIVSLRSVVSTEPPEIEN
jgi:hypothetical protein